eukprot:6181507-Pleurochrysis_carterae.AAC.1
MHLAVLSIRALSGLMIARDAGNSEKANRRNCQGQVGKVKISQENKRSDRQPTDRRGAGAADSHKRGIVTDKRARGRTGEKEKEIA